MSTLDEGLKTIVNYVGYHTEQIGDTIRVESQTHKGVWCNITDFEYHADYNLLMPVAKKVVEELREILKVPDLNTTDWVIANDVRDNIMQWSTFSDIEKLLPATISGIELINTHNQYKNEPK